jgi:hypothetical protein
MAHRTTLQAITAVTEDQWGLITRQQLDETGIAGTTQARLIDAGVLERVAHGVYRLRGAPAVDHLDLRAAWLQLAPTVPAWARRPAEGVVSHRSAASVLGLGHLDADVHEFILPSRRQSRRSDLRLRLRHLGPDEWIHRSGLPVTRPARIAADLLAAREDPQAIAHIVVDALRLGQDDPATVAAAIAPHATKFRLVGGPALLEWLLDLVGHPEGPTWLHTVGGGQ